MNSKLGAAPRTQTNMALEHLRNLYESDKRDSGLGIRGALNLGGAANCLPESLTCCRNELFSSRIELHIVSGKTIFSEEIARIK